MHTKRYLDTKSTLNLQGKPTVAATTWANLFDWGEGGGGDAELFTYPYTLKVQARPP